MGLPHAVAPILHCYARHCSAKPLARADSGDHAVLEISRSVGASTLNDPQGLGREEDVEREIGDFWGDLVLAHDLERCPFAGTSSYGETQTRTGDTTIFSRVLYQLSYLAETGTVYRARKRDVRTGDTAPRTTL